MIKMKLQNKLIIFSMFLLVPLTIYAYFLIKENVSNTKNQILNSTVGISEVVRSNVDIYLVDTVNLLMTIASSPALREKSQRETMSYFIEILPLHPNLLNLFAAHEDGKVFASVVWRGEDPPDITNREEFQEALQTGRPALSKRIISRATGQMALSVMVPITNKAGKAIGVLGADLSVKNLQNSLNEADTKRMTTIAITDENGVVLVHSNYRYVNDETSLSNMLPFQLAMQGEQGITRWKDQESGQLFWYAFLPTRSFPGAVLVSLPDVITQPPVRANMVKWFQALILVVIAVVSLSVFFARKITMPIKDLVSATKVISLDNPRQKVEIKSRDELGELAYSFNIMSDRLGDNIEKLAVANDKIAKKEQELRRLLSHLVRAQEEERSRIAADIHDGVTQMIVGALFEIKAALNLMGQISAPSVKNLHNSMKLLSETITEMQRVIFNLRPPVLEGLGLVPALKWHCTMMKSIYGIQLNITLGGEVIKLNSVTEAMIYRIVQEGVRNAIKHSVASAVEIIVSFNKINLTISIKDNGRGFNPNDPPKQSTRGFGLIIMKERANSIGAKIEILSNLGSGTEIILVTNLESNINRA